jgi:hypothetical protein
MSGGVGMADEEHLSILEQGAEVWNRWRAENPCTQPNLSEAPLHSIDLRGAYLSDAVLALADLSNSNLLEADLSWAKLLEANLSEAHLCNANLHSADLAGANMRAADLRLAFLIEADLNGADLRGANLHDADLRGANLSGANLRGADLSATDLSEASLREANLSRAQAADTSFVALNLSVATGLETIEHWAPSFISFDTIRKSEGIVPEVFLSGCGLSDWEIEAAKLYRPGLGHDEVNDILYKMHDLRTHQAIQINPLFISYSHMDSPFVDHMEDCLNGRGIRFWRDVHHATAGRLEKVVDRAIRHNPTVLLILSKHSVNSDWVQHEVRLARKLEIETERDVLCPVALDDSWKTCRWPERLREQIEEYHILDFSDWQDEARFQRMFTRLIDGLDLFYKE